MVSQRDIQVGVNLSTFVKPNSNYLTKTSVKFFRCEIKSRENQIKRLQSQKIQQKQEEWERFIT